MKKHQNLKQMFLFFQVNTKDVVEWVKNPVPVNEYIRQQCKFPRHAPCFPNTCGNLRRSDSEVRTLITF